MLCAVLLAAVPLEGQTAATVKRKTPGHGIALRIKPKVGDTLYTRAEQQMEMTATTRLGAEDTTMRVHTTMLMLSHTVVQESDGDGTTVVSVTDSVAVSSTGGRAATPSEDARRALQGKRVRMRITPEGTASVLDGPDAPPRDVQALFAQMPAALPKRPVAVGETWTQQTAIPLAAQPSSRGAGVLNVTFRLDSLSRAGELAHVSMRGTLTRDSTAPLPQGIKVAMTGHITGSILVDRRLGWMTDSRTTIAVQSVLTPPPRSKSHPMHFQMRITQRFRTTDDR